jgi:hypothetical protein
MKKLLFCCFSVAFWTIFSSSIVSSQAPTKLWDKDYGGSLGDFLGGIVSNPDGTYLLSGQSYSNISGDKTENSRGSYNYWIIKIDQDGNKLWDRTYGGNVMDFFGSTISTSDGGYLLGGYTNSGQAYDKTEPSRGEYDYWVVKVDANGNKLWDKTLGGSGYDAGGGVLQTLDGGYLVWGQSPSPASGDKSENSFGDVDVWIVKLNANGQKLWDKTIGGNNYDDCNVIRQTSDGGYILAGNSTSTISGFKSENCRGEMDFWVLKVDANFQKVWDKTIGGSNNDFLRSMTLTSDGNILLAGRSESPASYEKSENARGYWDYWVVKLDQNGNKVWDKTIGGADLWEDCFPVIEASDGNYLVAGQSASPIGYEKSETSLGEDYWVIKLDVNGNKIWDRTIGSSAEEACVTLVQTVDGGYLLGGTTKGNISGQKTQNSKGDADYWIVKLAADYPPPKAQCKNFTIHLNTSGNCLLQPGDIDAGSDGHNISLTVTPSNFNCSNIGDNSVTLSVKDDFGRTATCNATVTVVDNIPPLAMCKDIIVNLDSDGQVLITAADVDNGSNDACGIESLILDKTSFTCSNTGVNLVTLSVIDYSGNISHCQANVTVKNASPEVSAVYGPEDPVQLGGSVLLNVNFSDDNPAALKINWQDGLVETINNLSMQSLAIDHLYNNPGVYSVTITLSDVCQQASVFDYRYLVIFDPTGGFVTGGGWINSPTGAYKPDPNLSGKANFGFVAKYKKGSTIPDGNTEFQFKAGNLNFQSSSYEDMRLVISGPKANFKGKGMLNGTGNYGFMVSVIDGQISGGGGFDKFRIKIWNIDNEGVIVYDNNLSETNENAEPVTVIEGGSIVIHKEQTKSGASENDILPTMEGPIVKHYPNPFNESLQFEFASPTQSNARIEIYDVTGRLVKIIFDNRIEGGVYYKTEFRPDNELEGIYFYRMMLDNKEFYGKAIYKK